jgi:hypothetical protein
MLDNKTRKTIKKEGIKMKFEKNDHVVCCYCGVEQVVEKGSDICLSCNKSGYLQWIHPVKGYEVDETPHIIGEYNPEGGN